MGAVLGTDRWYSIDISNRSSDSSLDNEERCAFAYIGRVRPMLAVYRQTTGEPPVPQLRSRETTGCQRKTPVPQLRSRETTGCQRKTPVPRFQLARLPSRWGVIISIRIRATLAAAFGLPSMRAAADIC